MCYRLVVIPRIIKLCVRAMPTITINIHELHHNSQAGAEDTGAGTQTTSTKTKGLIFIDIFLYFCIHMA